MYTLWQYLSYGTIILTFWPWPWPWILAYFWKTLTLAPIYKWLTPGQRLCLLTTLISFVLGEVTREDSTCSKGYMKMKGINIFETFTARTIFVDKNATIIVHIFINLITTGTRQIIRYRANKVIHCLKGGYKTNGDIIYFRQSMKRCTWRPFRKIIPHQGC